MFVRFKTKELIIISFLSALTFGIAMVITPILMVLTANPSAGGFITPLFILLFLVLSKKLVQKPITGTVFLLIYGILAVPTTLITGVPTIFKIIPVIIGGLSFDFTTKFLKNKSGLIIASGICSFLVAISGISLGILLGLPALDKVVKMLIPLLIWMITIGSIGGYIGYLIYQKIKNKPFIKQMQN